MKFFFSFLGVPRGDNLPKNEALFSVPPQARKGGVDDTSELVWCIIWFSVYVFEDFIFRSSKIADSTPPHDHVSF